MIWGISVKLILMKFRSESKLNFKDMETNISPLDRILRIVFAIGVITLVFFVHSIAPVIGMAFIVIAGVLVVTSIFGFCPLYALVDFKTSRR